jgi:hypothetical protein
MLRFALEPRERRRRVLARSPEPLADCAAPAHAVRLPTSAGRVLTRVADSRPAEASIVGHGEAHTFGVALSVPWCAVGRAQSRHGGSAVQTITYRVTPPDRDGRSSNGAPHFGQYSVGVVARPSSSSRWQAAQSVASGRAWIRSRPIALPHAEQALSPGQSAASSRAGPTARPVVPHCGHARRPAADRSSSQRISHSGSLVARSFLARRSQRAASSGPQTSAHEQRGQRSSTYGFGGLMFRPLVESSGEGASGLATPGGRGPPRRGSGGRRTAKAAERRRRCAGFGRSPNRT